MLVWLWSADIQHRRRLCLVPMTVLIILLTSCFQVICDETYEFPRKSLDALASLGLLGLIVPKELGGLGQSHVCAAMVVETIARYGCPSTAMVYGKYTYNSSLYWLMVFITCFTRQIAHTDWLKPFRHQKWPAASFPLQYNYFITCISHENRGND